MVNRNNYQKRFPSFYLELQLQFYKYFYRVFLER